MTIEQMRERKKELGYTNEQLSQLSGVPIGTLQKVLGGATRSPRYDTLQCIEAVLWPEGEAQQASALREETSYRAKGGDAWDRQGTYTIDDYYALPDEKRVELIDGVFYDMAAPTTIHQSIAGFLHKKFLDFVMANKGPCFPFISPVDVQLDCDDKTVVQPDVLVVCDRTKYKNGRVFGAPDLVIEVLSPSTRRKDMQLKMYKYAGAGVREYWMVDPEKKLIVQYDLEHLGIPAIYNFQSVIPVLIWGGACRIDLGEMDETIGFLWEL